MRVLRQATSARPYARPLRTELAALRATIPYPAGTRPVGPTGVSAVVSPWDAFGLAAIFGVVGVVGLGGWWTTRRKWSGPTALLGVGGFLLAVGLAVVVRPTPQEDVAVVRQETVLRAGNAESYPPKLPERVPVGAEVGVRTRRGGWVQVVFANGIVGWLPEVAVLW